MQNPILALWEITYYVNILYVSGICIHYTVGRQLTEHFTYPNPSVNPTSTYTQL